MKKIVGAMLMASVFGVSSAWAICTSWYCGGISFSMGYRYANHDGQGAQINHQDGYVGFGVRLATPGELLQFVGNYRGTFIGGQSKVVGLPDDVGGRNSGGGFGDINLKLGLNLASQEVPFYVNVFAASDGYSTRIQEKGLDVLVGYYGVELDGKFPAGTGNQIEWIW